MCVLLFDVFNHLLLRKTDVLKTCWKTHSLKSGPETRDSETQDPETRDSGTRDPVTLGLGTCDPGTWDPDTRSPGNGTLGPCDQQLAPTTDCINFNCKANFERAWHVCRKRWSSNTKIKFRDIFFSVLCQKQVNIVPSSYFCCIRYLFGERCSLITFGKIETFICQSQKQTFAFKLDNFRLSELFRSKGEK